MIDRRTFLAAGLGSAAGLTAAPGLAQTPRTDADGDAELFGEPFRLHYAPHFGMFRAHAGEGLIDQIRFAHRVGFRAWEDNGMMGRDPAVQREIGAALKDLGMTMGVFVADAEWNEPIYVRGGAEAHRRLRERMQRAVEVAQRVGAYWVTVVPGPSVNDLEWDYQTANVIGCLRAMAEVCEPAGLVMVLEPLNPWANHPGMFLTKVPQAYLICRAVDSPSCKVLDDLYHQQVTEGNLIPNIDRAWDEIAYIQVGDSPGRKEPGTGEINYRNVFAHLHGKGYRGVVGMEHGLSGSGKAGERRLIEAYRAADAF